MRKEKIILSIAAGIVGILVALGAFFFYQSTKQLRSNQIKKITIETPTPNPESGMFIKISTPKDEEVVEDRVIKVSGKTVANSKIVVLSDTFQQAGVADDSGNFSIDITLSENENILQISSISPNGEIAKTERVVTYSTESF